MNKSFFANSPLNDAVSDSPQSRLYPHSFISEYLVRLKERRSSGLTDDPLRFDLVATFDSLTAKLKEEADGFFRKNGRKTPFFATRRTAMPLLIRRTEEEEALWREMTLDTRFYAAYQSILLPSWAIRKGFFFHRSYVKEGNYLHIIGGDGGIEYGAILFDPVYDGEKRNLITVASSILLPFILCSVLSLSLSPHLMGFVFPISLVCSFILFRSGAKRAVRERHIFYENLKDMAFNRFQKRLKKKGGTGFGLSSRSAYVSSQSCYDELVRMLTLFSREPGLATRSECVDMLWHEFISDTFLYRRLCRDILGRKTLVNHVPSTQVNDPHIVQRYQDFLIRYMQEYQVAPPRKFWPYETSTRTAPSRTSSTPPRYEDTYNDGVDVFLPYGLFGLGYGLGSADAVIASEVSHDNSAPSYAAAETPTPSYQPDSTPSPSPSGDYGSDTSSFSDGGSGGGDSGGSDGGSCGDSGGSGCSSGCSC